MKNLNSINKFEIIRSNERGMANHGWLKSAHTFSFANYYNLKRMGFSDLRVINDDYIDAGQGFGTHPHASMEIFSYVTEGSLEHKDSMGNGTIIKTGDVQLMSAGDGVRHSEFNPDQSQRTHLFQIWLFPNTQGGTPTYQQKYFPPSDKQGKLKLIISNSPSDEHLFIKQNASIYAGLFNDDEKTSFSMNKSRSYFIHVIKGNISFNDISLQQGDALAIYDAEGELHIHNANEAEILLFDLNKA